MTPFPLSVCLFASLKVSQPQSLFLPSALCTFPCIRISLQFWNLIYPLIRPSDFQLQLSKMLFILFRQRRWCILHNIRVKASLRHIILPMELLHPRRPPQAVEDFWPSVFIKDVGRKLRQLVAQWEQLLSGLNKVRDV